MKRTFILILFSASIFAQTSINTAGGSDANTISYSIGEVIPVMQQNAEESAPVLGVLTYEYTPPAKVIIKKRTILQKLISIILSIFKH